MTIKQYNDAMKNYLWNIITDNTIKTKNNEDIKPVKFNRFEDIYLIIDNFELEEQVLILREQKETIKEAIKNNYEFFIWTEKGKWFLEY